MTLIYNPNLAKVKVDPHAGQGQTVQAGEHRQTNGRPDERYQTYHLPGMKQEAPWPDTSFPHLLTLGKPLNTEAQEGLLVY